MGEAIMVLKYTEAY